MAIELQFRAPVFRTVVARAAQAMLNTVCIPPFGSVYVDHIDVAGEPDMIEVGGTVRLRLPVDVFIVPRAALLAAPNAQPAGATAPAGRVALLLDIVVHGAAVSLQCVGVDLGPLDAALGADAEDAMRKALGAPAAFDLTAALRTLGVPAPTQGRSFLMGDIVSIRFEFFGEPSPHLFPGQDWGLFLDGTIMEQAALSAFPAASVRQTIPGLVLGAHWRPQGATPHVDIDFAGKPNLPRFETADFSAVAACDFAVTPPPPQGQRLRITVHWSYDVRVDGVRIPDLIRKEFIDGPVESTMDPKKFGATPAGEHAFTIERVLPNLSFGGAKLLYGSAVASPDGMTIGGPMIAAVVATDMVQSWVTSFGPAMWRWICSRDGRTEPKLRVRPAEVATSASAGFVDGGTVCDVEVVSPANQIKQIVWVNGSVVQVTLDGLTALGIGDPVTLIVRTSRGVRFVDLGIPFHVELDKDGFVVNASSFFIDDCLYVPLGPRDLYGINWGKELISPEANPQQGIDWTSYVAGKAGFDVQLVALSGLEAGELIQFRSAEHAVDVTADRNGRVVVPAILPVMDAPLGASLIRVNRRAIAGHVTVRAVIFERQAALPAGRSNRLTAFADGIAHLTSAFEDRVEIHQLGPLGVSTRIAEYRPQPEDSVAPGIACDLPGLVSLLPIPGFADEQLAIGLMTDGSLLVLEFEAGTFVRVAGTFTGPIGAVAIAEGWATAAGAAGIVVYRVSRADAPRRPLPADKPEAPYASA
jgi:hypothetical protein